MADTDSNAHRLKDQRNIFDKTHAFLDPHIRLVKNSIYVVAGLGVILIARRIHMTKIFTRVEDIPKEFITQHIKLLGKVTNVEDQGVLQVKHIPIVRLPFVAQKRESLAISLAFINISPYGRKWLVDNIHNKDVWFKLLYLDTTVSPPRLYTDVQLPKLLRNTSVNEELIEQGLCRVASLDTNYSSFHEDKFLLKYLDKLIKLESVASHKKVGLWGSAEILAKKENKHIRTSFRIIKSVVSSPYNLFKWIFTKIKNMK